MFISLSLKSITTFKNFKKINKRKNLSNEREVCMYLEDSCFLRLLLRKLLYRYNWTMITKYILNKKITNNFKVRRNNLRDTYVRISNII